MTTQSRKAGLLFPVGRIARLMRDSQVAPRVSEGAPIYVAAVLEYLASELLEVSGKAARTAKVKRITPKHIREAVRNDAELAKIVHLHELPI